MDSADQGEFIWSRKTANRRNTGGQRRVSNAEADSGRNNPGYAKAVGGLETMGRAAVNFVNGVSVRGSKSTRQTADEQVSFSGASGPSGKTKELSSSRSIEGARKSRHTFKISSLPKFSREHILRLKDLIAKAAVQATVRKRKHDIGDHTPNHAFEKTPAAGSKFRDRAASAVADKSSGAQLTAPLDPVPQGPALTFLGWENKLANSESDTESNPGSSLSSSETDGVPCVAENHPNPQACGEYQQATTTESLQNGTQDQTGSTGATTGPSRPVQPSSGPSGGGNGPDRNLGRKHGRSSDLSSDDNSDRASNKVRGKRRLEIPDNEPFACLYAKKDGVRYAGCKKHKLTRIGDLQQHLSRKHYVGLQCPDCDKSFKTEFKRDEHISAANCSSRSRLPHERISKEKQDQLKALPSHTMSPVELWYAKFDIVFKGHARPASPYWGDTDLELMQAAYGHLPSELNRRISESLASHGVTLPAEVNLEAICSDTVQEILAHIMSQLEGDKPSASNHLLVPDTRPMTDSGFVTQTTPSAVQKPVTDVSSPGTVVSTGNRAPAETSRPAGNPPIHIVIEGTGGEALNWTEGSGQPAQGTEGAVDDLDVSDLDSVGSGDGTPLQEPRSASNYDLLRAYLQEEVIDDKEPGEFFNSLNVADRTGKAGGVTLLHNQIRGCRCQRQARPARKDAMQGLDKMSIE